jgi:hypothetical protein
MMSEHQSKMPVFVSSHLFNNRNLRKIMNAMHERAENYEDDEREDVLDDLILKAEETYLLVYKYNLYINKNNGKITEQHGQEVKNLDKLIHEIIAIVEIGEIRIKQR